LLFSARPRLSSSEGSYVKILAADANGNVCAVGSRNGEFLTVKYSPSGAKLWEKTYTGLAGGVSLASDVAAPVASGSVYVVGVSSADGGGKEYVTIKYTHSGQRAWVRRFSPGADVTTYYEPMVAARGSKVYACVTVGVGGGNYRVKTFAYDVDDGPGVYGMESWVKNWQQNGGRVEAASLVVDSKGRVHVAARLYHESINWEMATQMYGANGGYYVARRYGLADKRHKASDIAVDDQGRQYVVGSRQGDGGWDMLTIKLLSQTN
jgi:hypothetical protein